MKLGWNNTSATLLAHMLLDRDVEYDELQSSCAQCGWLPVLEGTCRCGAVYDTARREPIMVPVWRPDANLPQTLTARHRRLPSAWRPENSPTAFQKKLAS